MHVKTIQATIMVDHQSLVYKSHLQSSKDSKSAMSPKPLTRSCHTTRQEPQESRQSASNDSSENQQVYLLLHPCSWRPSLNKSKYSPLLLNTLENSISLAEMTKAVDFTRIPGICESLGKYSFVYTICYNNYFYFMYRYISNVENFVFASASQSNMR